MHRTGVFKVSPNVSICVVAFACNVFHAFVSWFFRGFGCFGNFRSAHPGTRGGGVGQSPIHRGGGGVLGTSICHGPDRLLSFAWKLFDDEGVLLFYGPKAELVRFWSSSNAASPESHAPSIAPITLNTCLAPPTPLSFEVRVPATERQLHAQVIAGLFGPFENFNTVQSQSMQTIVFGGKYLKADPLALAHNFIMGGSSIVCTHPNELRKRAILSENKDVNQADPEHQQVGLTNRGEGAHRNGRAISRGPHRS